MSLLRKRKRMLVLDDDPSMQRLISTLLQRAGHRVDAVSSGTQAIERLAQQNYDALLLDIMTPTDGGMTVIRHLREAQPATLSRVVLVTASPDAVLQNIEDVYAIVRKPFQPEELLATVDRVLGG